MMPTRILHVKLTEIWKQSSSSSLRRSRATLSHRGTPLQGPFLWIWNWIEFLIIYTESLTSKSWLIPHCIKILMSQQKLKHPECCCQIGFFYTFEHDFELRNLNLKMTRTRTLAQNLTLSSYTHLLHGSLSYLDVESSVQQQRLL